MTKGLMSFFQHSSTPSLQGRDFQGLLQSLNYLFIGYNFVIFFWGSNRPLPFESGLYCRNNHNFTGKQFDFPWSFEKL
jgi:hypothetical protein